ncbi:MAG TPA: hypothetical protein VK968_02950 [Roseimicrobium sp.]|nr:hypothetical protein [Roseimicrobium sp.]
MTDPYDSVRTKVASIFDELAGERAKNLESITPDEVTGAIAQALNGEGADEETDRLNREIAFHLTDWNCDAAFVVALQLYPERFTPEEIQAGIGLFLVHAPAHVIAAARLSGNSTDDVFAEGKDPFPGQSDSGSDEAPTD